MISDRLRLLSSKEIGVEVPVAGVVGSIQHHVDVVVMKDADCLDKLFKMLTVSPDWEPRLACPRWEKSLQRMSMEICMALLKAGEVILMPLAVAGLTLDRLIEDNSAAVVMMSPAGVMVAMLSEEIMNHGECEHCANAVPSRKNSN